MTVTVPNTTGDVRLTRQGRRNLTTRARNLRSEVIPRLAEMRRSPDSEDSVFADYERATAELARICAVLANARPAEALPDDPEVVELGEAVTIRLDGAPPERYVIVHPSEAAVGTGRASAHSPLGRALLGRRVGDEVEVPAPGGAYRCVIESATRAEPARPRRNRAR